MKRTSLLYALAVVICTVTAYSNESGRVDIYRPDKGDDTVKIDEIHSHSKPTADGIAVESRITDYRWPGVTWRGKWNLEACDRIEAELRNDESVPLSLTLRVDDPEAARKNIWPSTTSLLEPGQTKKLTVSFPARVPEFLTKKVFGMRGLPGGIQADVHSGYGKALPFDRSNIIAIWVYGHNFEKPRRFTVKRISAHPAAAGNRHADLSRITESDFFPMIDRFGQYKHEDWPGKIHTEADFAKAIADEQADWAAHPTSPERNRFGGWKTGPKQKATGHFRTGKVSGKWWLIDPEGCLFWSHGVDCVNSHAATGITGREHLFGELPAKDSPLAAFYGRAHGAPHGYYVNKEYKTFNFTQANLYRKFGPKWSDQFAQWCHRRLASWGMNTIANWSDPAIYALRLTPYTATITTSSPRIAGSEGFWGKFPDPFHPEFRNALVRFCDSHQALLDDQWCIGFFVNNELSWGDDTSLSRAALASPKEQPVKNAFLRWLTEKYKTIDALNAAWQADYKDWNDLLVRTKSTGNEKNGADLKAFYQVIAEEYFRVVHEVLRQKAPNKLDLGCRFAWRNKSAVVAATKYVDVVSFNLYEYDISGFSLPDNLDLPCIVGEFHFGALDRGMFHPGLKKTKDQNDRAKKYEEYVRGALRNTHMVGTHWFQFGSQSTTGRFDGENYQIGLVDLCDTPYRETIDALRRVGNSMYSYRYADSRP